MKATKNLYVDYLNEIGCPLDDLKSNGGLVPDSCNYGNWLRKNAPIAFEVGYSEFKLGYEAGFKN